MLKRNILLATLIFSFGVVSASLADRASDLKKYHALVAGIQFFPKQDYQSVAKQIQLGANNVTFMSFYIDQSDLPWCNFYVGGQVVESTPKSFSGHVDETLGFSVHGATAVQVEKNIIEYRGVEIIWPDPVRRTINALWSDYQGNYSKEELLVFDAIRRAEVSMNGASLREISAFLNTIPQDGYDRFVRSVKKERLALMVENGLSDVVPKEFASQPVVFFYKNTTTLRLPVADVNTDNLVNNLNELGSHCAKFAR